MRADVLLVERGLAPSRTKAQALIMAGQVLSGDERVDKAGAVLDPETPLRVADGPRFVSRGGDKLDHALGVFAAHGLEVAGKVCVDIGASTGGFTDCLLQRAAARVYAVDVGHGQLHPRLRSDPRVVVRERTNARHLGARDFDDPIELVTVDASFIGLGMLMDAVADMIAPAGELVALIKPQFEAGKLAASRGRGVIRDAGIRQQAIDQALAAVRRSGFSIAADCACAVTGPKGNVEHFVYARRDGR